MKRYYLVKSYGSSEKSMDIDVSDCPVDGEGNVSEEDAAIEAIGQLGWTFCIED